MNGQYYEGRWKNDLRHGEGAEYYENGNIMYRGYFIYGNFNFLKNDVFL